MKRKKTKKINLKRDLKKSVSKAASIGQFKFSESYVSLILGAIVVLIVGILFISFARGNRNMQTSSTKIEPKMEQQKSPEKSATVITSDSKTSSTYTIKPGDDLWAISENVYNDGYKWIEIAKANKLENPGLIHVGNKLMIPVIAKKEIAAIKSEMTPKVSDKTMVNNSITGNVYTIMHGDNLWDIAVRAYGDGFRWPDIAKANNLENPGLIFSDNLLKIPR